MNVGQRINARKIVLGYFYQRCFFSQLEKNSIVLRDVLDAADIFPSQENYSEEKQELVEIIKKYIDPKSAKDELGYFVEYFFDKWNKEDIDLDFVFEVGAAFDKYQAELIEKVNKYATTFSYEQMDTMDQALFMLGFVESKVLDTPKEVLLNEMIELSKRYADDGAKKLINGIMHKILSE